MRYGFQWLNQDIEYIIAFGGSIRYVITKHWVGHYLELPCTLRPDFTYGNGLYKDKTGKTT